MDLPLEEERVLLALVPARAGREHVFVFPEIDGGAEIRPFAVGVVVKQVGAHEHGVREHVDVAGEGEQPAPVVVGPVHALDDLPVGAQHRGAALEDGEAVLRVVVQDARAQDVVLLVAQLDHRAAELREALVDEVVQLLAGQDRLALRQADVAEAVDDLVVHVPEGRVAGKIGAVVQEGRLHRLTREPAVHLHLLQEAGVEQTYQRIRLPGTALGRQGKRGEQKGREET